MKSQNIDKLICEIIGANLHDDHISYCDGEATIVMAFPTLSLDTMNYLEKMLAPKERWRYIDLILEPDDDRVPYDELWSFTHASAEQKAKAFLQTKIN